MTSPYDDHDGTSIPTVLDNALNPEGLVVVHATRYRPVINEDGSVSIPSSYQATEGRYPRSTVHFTLNHKVTGHTEGNWDDTGYAVIAPFNDIVAQEGPPAMLHVVDTFWPTNAKAPLRLPNAVVIMPAEVGTEDTITIEGNVVKYKVDNYDTLDEQIIAGSYQAQQKLARAESPEERTRMLREMAMNRATETAIKNFGCAIEEGDAYQWKRGDFNLEWVQALADKIGTEANKPHTWSKYGLYGSSHFP